MKRILNNFRRKDIRKELRKYQTPQEVILWSRLRNNQTQYKWRRQVSIGPYVADFYCSKKLLAIEVDGYQHESNRSYDKERENYFLALGIKTMRFWNNEININIEGVVDMIMRELEILSHTNLTPALSWKERGPDKMSTQLYQPHPSPLLEGEGARKIATNKLRHK